MQHVNFETVVKEGYIKLPEKFYDLNNRKVLVEIYDNERKSNHSGKIEQTEKFLEKYKGMLKHASLPIDLSVKKIRESRLKEKYDL